MSLGDALGRLAAPPTAAPFENFRMELVDDLLAKAGKGPLRPSDWSGVLESVVRGIESKVMTEADTRLRAAAAYSRFPQRKLYALLPTPDRAEVLRNRLLAAAIPLERYESAGTDAMTQRSRGVALETAWEGVIAVARAEVAAWQRIADEILSWRRPLAPLLITSGVAVSVALISAAWLGGFLPAPQWFDPVASAFWGLPWW